MYRISHENNEGDFDELKCLLLIPVRDDNTLFSVCLTVWMGSFDGASQLLVCENSQDTLGNYILQYIIEYE
jgi:hypothetical protein